MGSSAGILAKYKWSLMPWHLKIFFFFKKRDVQAVPASLCLSRQEAQGHYKNIFMQAMLIFLCHGTRFNFLDVRHESWQPKRLYVCCVDNNRNKYSRLH